MRPPDNVLCCIGCRLQYLCYYFLVLSLSTCFVMLSHKNYLITYVRPDEPISAATSSASDGQYINPSFSYHPRDGRGTISLRVCIGPTLSDAYLVKCVLNIFPPIRRILIPLKKHSHPSKHGSALTMTMYWVRWAVAPVLTYTDIRLYSSSHYRKQLSGFGTQAIYVISRSCNVFE